MKVLWLAWRDYKHPERGGAEVVLEELLHRQVAEGHTVTLLTSGYPGAAARETMDGIEVIRVGNNRYAHPLQALWYYLRKLRGKYDVVIETVNTAPYFSLLFRGKSQGLALYHQLARDVWFFETKAPLAQFGYYLMEPFARWLLGRSRVPLVTVSESSKHDLAKFGWSPERTHIISEGLHIERLQDLGSVQKFERPTVLSHGSLRPMKRTLDQVKAFEFAKLKMPELQMKISGDSDSEYGREVLD